MKLSRLKFREIKIPLLSYYLIFLAILFIIFGAAMNMNVIRHNGGRMPVWNTYTIIDTEEHFTITNIDEVEQLQFADIFHIGNSIFSIGDIFLFIGIDFLIMSLLLSYYNITIDRIIRFKLNKAYKAQFK